MTADIDRTKEAVRQRVWRALDAHHAVVPPGAAGHIPSFVGAEQAATRLAALPAWQAARVIKANPDKAQLPVRVHALRDGKLLYMAVPRLASAQPFYVLDPSQVGVPFEQAASSKGAREAAPTIGVEELQPVDLVICGSVAVNREGVRIGKGAGYSDIEVALLAEAGLIGAQTTIATTVHDLQLIDEPLPVTEHDFGVDVIVTPNAAIHCDRSRRPAGLYWDHLSHEQIATIPVLAARWPQHRRGNSDNESR